MPVVVDRGRAALDAQCADGEHLAVVVQAEFLLPAEGHVLECHAVRFARGVDTHVETVDFHVLDEQRADVLGEAHVDADDARAVARGDLHVVDGALHGGVEADTDGAGVLLAGAEREVADGVPLSRVRAVTCVDDRLREIRVLESRDVVLEGDDGSAHAFALEDGAPVILVGLVRGRPLEGRGNLVDAVREVDDVVTVRVVAQGFLDCFGIIVFAVALGVVGVFLHVDDLGTHGELHLGVGKQGGRADYSYKRAQRNH